MKHLLNFYCLLTLLLIAFPTSGQQLPEGAMPSRLLTSEKVPYNYREQLQITGLSVDLLRLMYGALPAPIELMPWPRALDTATKTPNVLIFTMAKSQQRLAQGFTFIGPVSTRYHWLYSTDAQLKGKLTLQHVIDKKLLVAGLRGGWLSAALQSQGVRLEQVGDYQQGVQMLLKQRAKFWLSTELEELAFATTQPDPLPLYPVLLIGCSANYLGLSPGSSTELQTDLRQRFDALSQHPDLSTLLTKWQLKLQQPLMYSRSTGFYLPEAGLTSCTPLPV